MMSYTAIDSDISDFLDSHLELTSVFSSAELRVNLRNAGHDEGAMVTALQAW